MLVLTSENEISGIIYCLFRGRQNLSYRVQQNFENRLPTTDVICKDIFEVGISLIVK